MTNFLQKCRYYRRSIGHRAPEGWPCRSSRIQNYYLYFSGKNDITPQYLWVSNSTPTSSPWKILLNRASHVSGTVTCRRGVGRLAGLSIPLAPVQWSGFVAWGAIPSTRVHPCFPTLYPGQGGLGTPPWGTFPCSSLPCTTTAVGGSSVG